MGLILSSSTLWKPDEIDPLRNALFFSGPLCSPWPPRTKPTSKYRTLRRAQPVALLFYPLRTFKHRRVRLLSKIGHHGGTFPHTSSILLTELPPSTGDSAKGSVVMSVSCLKSPSAHNLSVLQPSLLSCSQDLICDSSYSKTRSQVQKILPVRPSAAHRRVPGSGFFRKFGNRGALDTRIIRYPITRAAFSLSARGNAVGPDRPVS